MCILRMDIKSGAARMVAHLATLPAEATITKYQASLEMDCEPKRVMSRLRDCLQRQIVKQDRVESCWHFSLAEGLIVRPSANGKMLEVWPSLDDELDHDKEPELSAILRLQVRAGDVPPPFTLAPASVFHLGGMVQR